MPKFQIKIPAYSILGFKILNSKNSILWAYILFIFEFLITPFFGVNSIEIIAGMFFILLINLSMIILISNSLIRVKRTYLYSIIFYVPLLINLPFSIKKILISFSVLLDFFI